VLPLHRYPTLDRDSRKDDRADSGSVIACLDLRDLGAQTGRFGELIVVAVLRAPLETTTRGRERVLGDRSVIDDRRCLVRNPHISLLPKG
jgi:hypothetical protein